MGRKPKFLGQSDQIQPVQHNSEWVKVANDAQLELWERQPEELDHEWECWKKYRDCWPTQKPKFSLVAASMRTVDASITEYHVKVIANKWDYPLRMQAWMRYCDDSTIRQRKEEIIAMNEQHLSMAHSLNEKLARAIESIDPENLRPLELKALLEISTKLEEKARINNTLTEHHLREQIAASNGVQLDNTSLIGLPGTEKNINQVAVSINSSHAQSPNGGNISSENPMSDEKKNELQEILKILGGAGVLGSKIGVRKTVTQTTEVISTDDEGTYPGDLADTTSIEPDSEGTG